MGLFTRHSRESGNPRVVEGVGSCSYALLFIRTWYEEQEEMKQEERAGVSAPALSATFEKDAPYELALILRSICSIRVSRFLFCFSYSRTLRSCSVERPSSLLEISATDNSS